MTVMHRKTGGNTFISENATVNELMAAIHDGILALVEWCDEDQEFDPGAISVETHRIPSGKISVDVGGDLREKRY